MVDSVSKRYSACGARIGCLVTRNTAVLAAVLKFAQARLSPPVVDQRAALAALSTPAAELQAVIADYRLRRDTLVAGLRAIPGVSAGTPMGAFYLIVGLPVDDAERFCIFLLSEFAHHGQTVMLAPADGFYCSAGLGKQQVRAAYVLERAKLQQACAVLAAALQAYPGTLR
jgi:aspartate aminotransferase